MARTAKTRAKLGPVSAAERAGYRARLPNDAAAGRPTETTARTVCGLLGVDPAVLRSARDQVDGDRVAAQAFTAAIDMVIMLGDRGEDGATLTFNSLVDTLGRYWSLRYRAAQLRGAMVTYDMAESTLTGDDGGAWRELQVAGVNVEAIWDLLVRQTEHPPSSEKPLGRPRRPPPDPHPGLAQLYTLRRVRGRGHATGRKVQLHEGRLLDDVRYAILRDSQYERPVYRRLLLADVWASALPTRQDVCEERPYDVVNLNERSRSVLSILERARIRFFVEQFREDFEALEDFTKHQPEPHYSQRAHRCGYARVVQSVRTLRPVYEQTAGLTDLLRDASGRAYIEIRSRFFRALNRRFDAHDFWPEHVPGDLRERWFGVDDIDERGLVIDPNDPDRFVEVGGDYPNRLVARDISSSQTQLLAAFLGLDDLEALAGSESPKFKEYLARRLWRLNVRTRGQLLAPGYAGQDDERLIAFVKELWMRRNYGGKFGETVHDLADDPGTYGPGWNSDVFASGGVRRAERYWRFFLAKLPAWSLTVSQFLDACQYIGRNADRQRGLTLVDPLDGAEVQWNPVARATKKLAVGKNHLELRPVGVIRRRGKTQRFVKRPWQVNTNELANRVAPCLVHTLDAYFNALVLEYLAWHGVTQVVAVHDGWYVPGDVSSGLFDDDGMELRSGEAFLQYAIRYVGPEWLSGVGRVPDGDKPFYYFTAVPPDKTRPGLAVVYDWFAESLRGSPYEAFACEVRDRWRRRVAEERWPQFTASRG